MNSLVDIFSCLGEAKSQVSNETETVTTSTNSNKRKEKKEMQFEREETEEQDRREDVDTEEREPTSSDREDIITECRNPPSSEECSRSFIEGTSIDIETDSVEKRTLERLKVILSEKTNTVDDYKRVFERMSQVAFHTASTAKDVEVEEQKQKQQEQDQVRDRYRVYQNSHDITVGTENSTYNVLNDNDDKNQNRATLSSEDESNYFFIKNRFNGSGISTLSTNSYFTNDSQSLSLSSGMLLGKGRLHVFNLRQHDTSMSTIFEESKGSSSFDDVCLIQSQFPSQQTSTVSKEEKVKDYESSSGSISVTEVGDQMHIDSIKTWGLKSVNSNALLTPSSKGKNSSLLPSPSSATSCDSVRTKLVRIKGDTRSMSRKS